ncbi:mobilization protein [Antarcticibacterium flavum]|uniref:Mobilization protein n=1 Tax=Antarcticibacterium flavum TaxID=2058175 RepID=A0A5B7X6M2_9FLAO|nr:MULTISPECIES: MobB family relaxase [Antarcticibacterium]MCM4160903.1 mobilization protein [Antarcticibacterium sp. W02-3]QCY71126.1 mobilization protein [Antarcticibacterium flavum]
MYITITPQNLSAGFSKSSAEFVSYLEKENQGLDKEDLEYFFNQHGDQISAKEVIWEIDSNTAKLKNTEPKFYSITVSPSKFELARLQNSREDLKKYTRELMKDYAASFNREINDRPVTVSDIKYFAKIEHQRTFKGTDKQVKENQPFATQILQLKTEIRQVERGEVGGNIRSLQKEINKLQQAAPHKQNGQRIVQGMPKEGNQSHIHIIVSRKDVTNTHSLSPGSKYKASEVMMNGKLVKRGFDRDAFFQKAEKTFDSNFAYKRNFVETYQSRKLFLRDHKLYFTSILGLPASEKAIALKMLREAGVPMLHIPINKFQLARKSINLLTSGIKAAIRSGSIGI